jgi:hypothetical protein
MKKIASMLVAVALLFSLTPATYAAQNSDSLASTAKSAVGKTYSDLGLPSKYWCGYFVGYCINNSSVCDMAGEKISRAYSMNPMTLINWTCAKKKIGTYNSLSSVHYKRLAETYSGLSIVETSEREFTPQPGDIIVFDWNGREDKSHTFSHVGIVTEFTGNSKKYVDGNSSTGNYIYVKEKSFSTSNNSIIGYIRLNASSDSTSKSSTVITFNSLTTPGNLTVGSSGHVDGSITSSNSPICSIVAKIYDTTSGNVVQTSTSNGFSVSTYGPIKNSKIDDNLRFGALPTGTYKIKYTATAKDGTSNTAETDTFQVTSTAAPSTSAEYGSGYDIAKYVKCATHITCPKRTVNLYKNPTDTVRYDYFSKGQSVSSATYAVMRDGSIWYQVNVSSNGNSVDLWLKDEPDLSITKRHTYGSIAYESEHPHKGYLQCECGQIAYSGTNTSVDTCQQCIAEQESRPSENVTAAIPAQSITITNGYRYLYIYKPTGEAIRQSGGDGYEVHMTPNSTYQLNVVVTPGNTTDRVQYSVHFPNNNPANGGGISVSEDGLITANSTAYGGVDIQITCGNCQENIYIVMCNTAGERI